MKNTLRVLTLLLCCTASFSCSNDNTPPVTPEPPVVVTPPTDLSKPPAASAWKPAVINIKKTNPTGKTSVVTKRLLKTITFTGTSAFDTQYKIKINDAEYLSLPTDNLYDPSEEALNVNTKKYDERIYSYNAAGNLEKITINNIAYPDYNSQPAYAPIVFNYNETGARTQIDRYQNAGAVLLYEYNSIGQITKARELNGNLKYTFEYDENNNISNKYFYAETPSGIKPQMRYTYTYFPDNTYSKDWIAVDLDGTEKKTSTVTYTFNKNVAGVYNNEPIYKILMDNREGLSYLHIISNSAGYKPKYFYDADGYLIKYDSSGLNNATDITLFIYE